MTFIIIIIIIIIRIIIRMSGKWLSSRVVFLRGQNIL